MTAQNYLAWARRFAGVGLVQGLVQVLSMASGLLVIRFLAPESYALYSLSYTMLGMMAVMSDSGISTGGMAEAGKAWQNPAALGQVVATVLNLRLRFALWVVGLGAPVLLYLLHSHGASWLTAVALAGLAIIQFVLTLHATAYNLAPALHQWIAETQKIAIVQNVGRFVGLALGMLAMPSAVMAMLAVVPAQVWNLRKTKQLSSALIQPNQQADPEVHERVMAVVRRVMPGAIYYAVSSQVTIWLISLFGSTDALAKVGALGRLGQVLAVVSSIFGIILVPRFARLAADHRRILVRYLQVLGLALAIALCICAFVALFPGQTLWILGRNYANLEHEVLLQAMLGSLSLLAGIAFQLGAVRSVVIRPIISIPMEILLQLCAIRLFKFDTVAGVLGFAMIASGVQLVMHVSYFLHRTLGRNEI